MPEIKAETDNLQVNKYSNGAVHFYDVNPANGLRTHISETQMLADRGHDVNGPRISPNPNQVPPPIDLQPVIDAINALVANQQPPAPVDLQPVIDAINQLAANQTNNPNANIMAQLMPFLQGMQTQMNTMMTLIQQLQNQNIAQAPQQPATPGTPPATPGTPTTPAAPTTGGPAAGNQQQQPAGPSPEQQEVNNALHELENRRRELAEIVVRRKTRSVEWLTPGARRDKRDYQHARELYDQAKARFMAAKAQLKQSEALANQDPLPTQDELAKDMMLQSYDEQTAFINEEFSVVDELRRNDGRWGRMLNRWAKVSTGKKIAIGLLVGGGATLVSGGLGLGVFGLAVGSASRFSLGIFGNRASTRNVSELTRKNMLEAVARRRRAAENSALNVANLAGYGDQLIQDSRRHETRAIKKAKRHQRVGALIMAASAIPFVRGLDHAAAHFNSAYRIPDIDWPNNINWPDFFGHHGHPGVAPSHPPYHVIDGGATHTGGGPGFPTHTGGGPGFPNSVSPEHHPKVFSLKGIHADTIHAKTPAEFQHGVIGLLHRQGVSVHGATPEALRKMTRWMDTHNIASGMARVANGPLEQNITTFPNPGEHFSNYLASAEQGFKIGADGTGTHGLDQWIRHAQSVGMTFERIKK